MSTEPAPKYTHTHTHTQTNIDTFIHRRDQKKDIYVTQTHTLEKVLITETSGAIWTERIHDSSIPASAPCIVVYVQFVSDY